MTDIVIGYAVGGERVESDMGLIFKLLTLGGVGHEVRKAHYRV